MSVQGRMAILILPAVSVAPTFLGDAKTARKVKAKPRRRIFNEEEVLFCQNGMDCFPVVESCPASSCGVKHGRLQAAVLIDYEEVDSNRHLWLI